MSQLELHSVIALLEDMPEKGLSRGQVGTIVAHLAADVYDVEFADLDGRAYAFVPLREGQLMQLLHERSGVAA
ncbi:hypothetical protein F183_A42240 [Bryobacterales bacterium F-183]|nr:hypothetical protein F183_A42240 [Bryobacterales bacterium F-183]